jgi:Asp-tRNA(Asn)/Glu-tRNA(Gln) amidotransferase A subunit family amidase
MQLLARPFDEATLLRVGAALEAAAAFQLPDRVLRW